MLRFACGWASTFQRGLFVVLESPIVFNLCVRQVDPGPPDAKREVATPEISRGNENTRAHLLRTQL